MSFDNHRPDRVIRCKECEKKYEQISVLEAQVQEQAREIARLRRLLDNMRDGGFYEG
jgi:hypothetical protein